MAGVSVCSYTLLEIAAEKLRCVLQRLQCRDLFDLYRLLGGAVVSPADAASLFRRKAEHRGIDPEQFAPKYRDRVCQYERRWVDELREHVRGELPHFDDVERRVARRLRHGGLL